MYDKIVDLIVAEAKELNEGREEKIPVEAGASAPLFGGDDGILTSIALVTLVVAVEQAVEDEFGTELVLANEKAMSMKNSPFQTIGALADYIVTLLKENGNG